MEIIIFTALSIIIIQNFYQMATQTELAAQVTALTTQVGKIGGETRTLLDKIQELTDIIANQGEVSPELQSAVDALKEQVSVVDGLVPDATEPGV